MGGSGEGQAYRDIVILESLGKDSKDSIFVLLLNYAGGGCENAEGSLAKTGVARLAGLEENTKQLGPLVAYISPKISNR